MIDLWREEYTVSDGIVSFSLTKNGSFEIGLAAILYLWLKNEEIWWTPFNGLLLR